MPEILIVDNHPLVREFLGQLLAQEGHTVHVAEDGLAALDLLQRIRPQVIFVDLLMPNIDGVALCRLLRRSPIHRQAYLVVISAVAAEAPELVGQCRANAALAKGPFRVLGPAAVRLVNEAAGHGFRGVREGIAGLEDIHARQITRELLLRKQHLEMVIESLEEGILEITSSGRVVFANAAAPALLGLEEERILATELGLLFSESDRQAVSGLLAAGGGTELELPRGERRLALRYYPFREQGGGGVLLLEDVTERRRMEARLIQAQRMESIGTLAAGVAHDFNNLLMTILGNAELMMADLSGSHPHYRQLQEIGRQVQSAKRLTGQLLGYSRRGRYEVRVLDCNRLVRETAEAFGRTRKEIVIRLELEEGLAPVEGDLGQLEQLLLNLLVNAGDAMPGGGELTLSSRGCGHEQISAGPFKPREGRYVRLAVRDTGVGMDARTRERIFEPFFTTKEMGRGTGLGLASVYGIVKGHGGYIEVDSAPGRGSEFRVFLPASSVSPPEPAAAPPPPQSERCLLLVDDERTVLTVAGDMLSRLGYSVLSASSGEEALRAFATHRGRISAVMLDLVMPGLSGVEVFARLRRMDPQLKVVLASGYSSEGEADRLLAQGAAAFLQKPFTIQQLAEALTGLLGPAPR
jgi:two-component system cell cycle sensor histidine kinase/response regulator CckA